MPRLLIIDPPQTIDYYVMYGLESGLHQATHIARKLDRETKQIISLSEKQISGSLQRLKKQNLVEYKRGKWELTKQNKQER